MEKFRVDGVIRRVRAVAARETDVRQLVDFLEEGDRALVGGNVLAVFLAFRQSEDVGLELFEKAVQLQPVKLGVAAFPREFQLVADAAELVAHAARLGVVRRVPVAEDVGRAAQRVKLAGGFERAGAERRILVADVGREEDLVVEQQSALENVAVETVVELPVGETHEAFARERLVDVGAPGGVGEVALAVVREGADAAAADADAVFLRIEIERFSGSRKATNSPRAARMPALRAGPTPAFSCVSTRTRGSRAAYSASTAGEESVEPSSTQMISMSRSVWLTTESRHSRRYFSAL